MIIIKSYKKAKVVKLADKLLHNPHVGEILKYEFIDEIGISQNSLAKAISVPPNRIHHIVNGQRSITADTDLRLCKFFNLSESYFLHMQSVYETMEVKRKITEEIRQIKPFIYDRKQQPHNETRV